MEADRVSESVSVSDNGSDNGTDTYTSYAQLFKAQEPYYLSIGMTVEEYWHGEPDLVVSFREADRLRLERENTIAWLTGLYTYRAVGSLSPILRFSMSKTPVKAEPYGEPISITAAQKEQKEIAEAKSNQDKIHAMMMKRVNINKEAQIKEEIDNG